MKEQLIEFKTAKLAKEKGFDIKSSYEYDELKVPQQYGLLEAHGLWRISAPTQALLQKWLRDIHGIHIVMVSGYSGFPNYDVCVMLNKTNYLREDKDYSYEEALEKGLKEALKLIK